MNLYRFSPIESKQDFDEAVQYVFEKVLKLSKDVTGMEFPVTYLTLFSHYEDEYEKLLETISQLGEIREANNGVKVPLKDYDFSELRIRKPDPYRMQVGCADFDVGNYLDFKNKHLGMCKGLRLIERAEYEMIEFFHPDYDVFAYVVS